MHAPQERLGEHIMTAESGAVVAVRMPQINVNDEEVTILNWRVEDGGRAVEGESLCEVETSKAVGELPSPTSGILRHAARTGDIVKIDAIVAYIGPSAAVVDSYLSMLRHDTAQVAGTAPAGLDATAGAVELARKMGVNLSEVTASGDRIRRSDVEKYLAGRPPVFAQPANPAAHTAHTVSMAGDVLPGPLQSVVEEAEALSNHDWAITQHLKDTQTRLAVAHALMDVNVQRAVEWIESEKQAGRMTSLLPVVMKAAAAAIYARLPQAR
jgi:pyruvate/2-oxoglutarate dehydrogenase complex dihydrolipoamide acyltransferase (E2) component